MRKFSLPIKKSSKVWLITAVLVLILLAGGVGALRSWQAHNLSPVAASNKDTSYFTVAAGSSVQDIGLDLKRASLIRSSQAFEIYVRGKELGVKLQAGTYILSPSMSVQQIVKKMTEGDVARNLFTILPGKSLKEIKKAFADAGYGKKEIQTAFNPITYADHPALASLPKGASLEGYLYPDSFQRLSNTPAKTIIRASLGEMSKHLTAELAAGFAANGLSIHKGIILASVVYMETDDPEPQPTVAQVFLKRLREGIRLESDATTSVYNTYENAGLPPTPISNVTASALNAVANPSKTDFLFFVSGDDDTTHFSKTRAEHEKAVQRYCTKKCG
ncbi:MAG: endolytic transglycosylase MltG [Candidatus Saccharimonadales bacterium]